MVMIISSCVLIILGVLIAFLGLMIWKKQKITLIHDYHYTKVKEKDIKHYTEAMGKAVIAIGLSVFLMGLLWVFNNIAAGTILFVAGFIAGMVMFYNAQKKYNGGIF